jgi:hypothetical protein
VAPENHSIRGKVAYTPLDSQPDLERDFFGRVTQSLCPRNPCGRLFVILTPYYDESGTHAESPAAVLAGFVGDTNDWVDFEIEWAKVFKSPQDHLRSGEAPFPSPKPAQKLELGSGGRTDRGSPAMFSSENFRKSPTLERTPS